MISADRVAVYGGINDTYEWIKCILGKSVTYWIYELNLRRSRNQYLIDCYRGKGHFYSWLKRNNYPQGYQILCMNCQWIKRVERREYRHGKSE